MWYITSWIFSSGRLEEFCKKVFLEISQNSQENTCASNFIKKEILAQIFSCEFCEISKNTFSYRTLWWLLLNVTSLRVNKFSIWLLFTLFIWILFTYIYYIQCHGRILNFRRMFYTLVFTMFSWCLLRQRRNNKQTKKTMTNMSELM